MSSKISREQLLDRLTESLRIIEVNTQLYDSGETVAWIPIAIELYKLLIDDRYGPLVPELLPTLVLYPLRSRPSDKSVSYELFSPGTSTKDRRIKFNLFNNDGNKIGLSNWLEQDIIEVKGSRPTIADFVIIMRHNLAAHISRKSLGGKARTIQKFGVIIETGIERPAFTRILIDIAQYLVDEINQEIGRQSGPRLPIIERRQLLEIAEKHNEAKGMMDEIVYDGAGLTEKKANSVIQKLEFSGKRLISPELKAWALMIYTHLGEAYRFSYLATKDKKCLFQAISALENAKIFMEESSPTAHRSLVYYNLGQIYYAASSALGYRTCNTIAYNYFQEVLDLISYDDNPELYLDTVNHMAWISLKLLKIQSSVEHFREIKSLKDTPA